MKHDARPSALFDLTRSFGGFLKMVHAEEESMPVTLQEMQAAAIKLVLTYSQDPDWCRNIRTVAGRVLRRR